MKAAAALLLLIANTAASAAWLSICADDAAAPTARVLAEALQPTGARRVMVGSADRIPACEGIELPVSLAQIRAGQFAASRLIRDSGAGVVVRGRADATGFKISEIFPRVSAVAAPLPAVAGVELLAVLEPSAFGVEARAALRRENGRLALECAEGTAPAGAVLRMASRGLPTATPLRLAIDYRASGVFEIGVTDQARAARGDPLMLATLLPTAQKAAPPLTGSRLDLTSIEAWTLLCPPRAARIELHSLRLEAPAAAVPPGRALWAWRASSWRDEPVALLDKLAAAHADTVFVTVPVVLAEGHVSDAPQLQTFVAAARKRGIAVWAVAGDPQAVLPQGRIAFAQRAAAYAGYNREAARDARLTGVQYDIEPYLNPGYSLDAPAWHQSYVETIRSLRRAGGELKLDLAVPFWWMGSQLPEGDLLDALAASADSLTVMNYRTDPVAIRQSAQPFLEWGVRARRGVRIALEAGPIADEEDRVYLPAPRGEVALYVVGGTDVLLLADTPAEFAAAKGVFSHSHTTRMLGTAISFQDSRARLDDLVEELERQWGAWSAFLGVALHEY